MTGTLSLEVPVVVETLADGNVRAAPLSARLWLTHGEEPDALEELRHFLEGELEHATPATLARLVAYGKPGHHVVRSVGASIPTDEDGGTPVPLDFACVVLAAHAKPLERAISRFTEAQRLRPGESPPSAVLPPIPRSGDTWIAVPILDHVFRLDDAVPLEDEAILDDTIAREIVRVAASLPSPLALLEALPPRRTRVELLALAVRRVERVGGTQKSAHLQSERQRRAEKARLLDEMGRRLGPRPVPIGRDAEVNELRRVLSAKVRRGALVRGPERAGKSAVIEHVLGTLPGPAYAVPLARFLAGEGGLGDWQARVDRVFEAAALLDATLYVEDLGGLALERPGSPIDLASAMAPYLEGRKVRFVGEIRDGELDRFQTRHARLGGSLLPVRVDRMGERETEGVLAATLGVGAAPEGHRALTPDAIGALVPLVARYLPLRALPGEALSVARALEASRPGVRDVEGKLPPLDRGELVAAFAERVGIPEALVRDELPLPPEEIAAALAVRVVGQREAVEVVARALAVVKAGLPPRGRPIATFLFVGPTGTGKTELARALGRYLFGSEAALARFDMSEYADPWAADRLVRGTDREDGLLTRRARERPFSVLLLDEIEKAHPAVYDLLLQVLGEGRLSDARGRTASFESAIIVMTSNLGTRGAGPVVGFGAASDGDALVAERTARAVREHFRPELLNRIDRVVPFRGLREEEARTIGTLLSEGIGARPGLTDRRHVLAVAPEAIGSVVDGVMAAGGGARALRRTLEDTLVVGVSSVLATASRDGLRVEVTKATGPSAGEVRVHRGLALRAVPASGRAGSVDRRPLDRVVALRRRLTRLAGLSAVVSMRSEVARLVAELSRAERHDDGRAKESIASRLGWLRTRIEAVDLGLGGLEALEDRVLRAVMDAAPAAELMRLAAHATRLALQTESAIWAVLYGWASDDDLSRTVVVLGSPRALGLFLLPLLEAEDTLDLGIDLSFPAGIATPPRPVPADWTDRHAWSPAFTAGEALAYLRKSPRLAMPRWGAVAACVHLYFSSPIATLLGRVLQGLVRFREGFSSHDLLLADVTTPPWDPAAKLPEVTSVPSQPHLLVDLDRGHTELEGEPERIPLEMVPAGPPEPTFDGAPTSPGRVGWPLLLPRLALAAAAVDEGL